MSSRLSSRSHDVSVLDGGSDFGTETETEDDGILSESARAEQRSFVRARIYDGLSALDDGGLNERAAAVAKTLENLDKQVLDHTSLQHFVNLARKLCSVFIFEIIRFFTVTI